MMKLSEAARTALINAASGRQGANVTESGRCTGEAAYELRDAGLIGIQGGLTRKGSIERERIMNAELDRAFG